MSLPSVYLGIIYYLIPTNILATGGYLRDLVQKPGKIQKVPLCKVVPQGQIQEGGGQI